MDNIIYATHLFIPVTSCPNFQNCEGARYCVRKVVNEPDSLNMIALTGREATRLCSQRVHIGCPDYQQSP